MKKNKKDLTELKYSNDDFIKLIGDNQTTPRVIYIGKKGKESLNESQKFWYGLYTYKNEVYILHDGYDNSLHSIDEITRECLYNKILTGDFEIDPSYQG